MSVQAFRTMVVAALVIAGVLSPCRPARLQADDGIEIAQVTHEGPIDFQKTILPVLRKKCLACHNSTDAESDLVLETPQSILKGGSEGPAVVAGNPGESLILLLAAHQRESYMPPEDNDVGAANMSPQELGLLKLWIEQGAVGSVENNTIRWQPLPAGVNPIYAAAISPNAQYAAAGRANQIFVFHLPGRREAGRLTDPALLAGDDARPGIAHLDLVQSLAFHPSGNLIASGGFRNVKLWRRPENVIVRERTLDDEPSACASHAAGGTVAIGTKSGKILLFAADQDEPLAAIDAHQDAVTGLAFLDDPPRLISGSRDKSLRLWNLEDHALLGQLETPCPLNALVSLAGGEQIAAGGEDKVIRLWNVALFTAESTGEPPAPAREIAGHNGPITALAQLADGNLISGSADGNLRVINPTNGGQIRAMNHGGPVVAIAATPDGRRLASASAAQKSAKLWEASNGKMIAELKGDSTAQWEVERRTQAVALAKRMIDLSKQDLDAANKRKTSEDENLKKSDEAAKKAEEELKTKTEAAKKPVEDKQAADKALVDAQAEVARAEQEKPKADEAAKKTVEAFAAAKATAEKTKQAAAESAKQQTAAEQARDQARQAAQADPENAELAQALAAAEKAAADSATSAAAAKQAQTQAEQALAKADEGKKQAEVAAQKSKTELDQAQKTVKQAEAEVKKLEAPATKVVNEKNAAQRALEAAQRAVERSKQTVAKAAEAVGPLTEAVKQREAEHVKAGEAQKVATEQSNSCLRAVVAVAFSSDGATLASAAEDGTVFLWNGETGAAMDCLRGHSAPVAALAFTEINRLRSMSLDKRLVLWDTNPAWQLERTIGSIDAADQFADRVTAVEFSPDGTLLATGSGEPSRSGEIKIWKVEDGSLVTEFKEPHSDTVFDLQFSPDGQHLVSGAADRFIKVFQVATGDFVRSFEGHTHHVLGVSWSADGRTLASSGADQVLKVWDYQTGDQKRTIQGFGKEVTDVCFVADSQNILTCSGDRNVQVKRTDNGGNVRSYGGASDFVYAIGASANGKTLIAAGQDSVMRVYQENGQVLASFEPPR